MGRQIVGSKEIKGLLARGTAEVIVEEELLQLLKVGKPLRIKYGVDPSKPDLHLGHVVCFRKLRQFQDLGHKIIVIVGDWTAQIGDPSGVSTTRPMLSAEEVRANAETYMRQFFKVVDEQRADIVWQSQWFGGFALADVIKLTSRFTVAQMLAREDFAKRHTEGRPIVITEFLYPLLQAYDSVAIEADVELGGTDQKFNLLLARELQQAVGQRPQQVFLVPLLVGTDGKIKMSKSQDNYIAVEDVPNEMYGKVMSISDDLILQYFELVTDVPEEEMEGFRRQLAEQSVNPIVLKQRLAREIVAQFYSVAAAQGAEEQFNRERRRREAPEDVQVGEYRYVPQPSLDLTMSALEAEVVRAYPGTSVEGAGAIYFGGRAEPIPGLLCKLPDAKYSVPCTGTANLLTATGLAESKSAAKRIVEQGALHIDGRKITEPVVPIRDGQILKVGRKRPRFVKTVNVDKLPSS